MAPSHSRTATSRAPSPYARKRTCMKSVELAAFCARGFPRPDAPAPTPTDPDRREGYVMLPHWFPTVMACEPLPVSQVILEVITLTIGYVGDNAYGRREWVHLTCRHFQHKGRMQKDTAAGALRYAVDEGYLKRRPFKRHGKYWTYEYAIAWCDLENVPSNEDLALFSCLDL
jgi:hypothetical protein